MDAARRWFVTRVPIAMLAAPSAAAAQPPGKVYRLGILLLEQPQRAERIRQLYSTRLGELGWQEGRNLTIDLRFTDVPDKTGELAASMATVNPDVLVGVGAYPAHSLKEATRTIPIVLAGIADPVGRGLVASLARPGGNITGVTHYVGIGLVGKSAQFLKELVPNAERVALLINPTNPLFATSVKVPERGMVQVRELGITMHYVEARTVDDISRAIDAAARARVDALIVSADPVFSAGRETILGLAAKYKLPTLYPIRGDVEAGGLVSYGTDFRALFRRSADYVDRILRGSKPADLPIEQPTKFELVINLKTAKALGLTIPPSLLLRADHVIE